jgi:hypothetical protein
VKVFPIWKIERMRDGVAKMEGKLNIRIFTSNGEVYRIWYNQSDRVALFGRVVWNEEEQCERMKKVYLKQIADALNAGDVKIRVEYRNAEKEPKWFDREEDENAVEEAYRCVMSFLKGEGGPVVSRSSAEDKD